MPCTTPASIAKRTNHDNFVRQSSARAAIASSRRFSAASTARPSAGPPRLVDPGGRGRIGLRVVDRLVKGSKREQLLLGEILHAPRVRIPAADHDLLRRL